MILTCPNCSTQYSVDAASLAPAGRKVRCRKCSFIWEQSPFEDDEDPVEARPRTQAEAPEPEAPAPEPPEPPESSEPTPPEAALPEAAPPLERPQRRRPGRRGAAVQVEPEARKWQALVAWFVLVFLVSAIIAGGYRFRQDLVDVWPPIAKLYEVAGLDVRLPPGYGLDVVLDVENTARSVIAGVPVLIIEGMIVNTSGLKREVAGIRVILRDDRDNPLQDWVFKPDAESLEPDASIPFKTRVENPDKRASNVRFEFLAKK